MAKYRLTAKHYWRDQLLMEGTLVGDDTPHPVPEEGPTYDMEPLDDEAKAKIEELHENRTKAFTAAPQVGLLYLQPETQEAVNQLIAAQSGAKSQKESQKEASKEYPSGAKPAPKEK